MNVVFFKIRNMDSILEFTRKHSKIPLKWDLV